MAPQVGCNEVPQEYGLELGIIDANNSMRALITAPYQGGGGDGLKQTVRGEPPTLSDVKSTFDQRSLTE